MNGRRRLLCLSAISIALTGLLPTVGRAELRPDPNGTAIETLDRNGNPDLRAGVHPYVLRQSFSLVNEGGGPNEALRDLEFDLPAGIGGDAHATPFCSKAVAHRSVVLCPPESRVGTVIDGSSSTPIYNVTPAPGQVAEFVVPGGLFPAGFVGRLRATDVGMTLRLIQIPSIYSGVASGTIELWGVPADHQVETSIPRRPLLTMPTQCGTPLVTVTKLRTWQNLDHLVVQDGEPAAPRTGCANVPFAPQVGLDLGSPRADSASGVTIGLEVPQSPDPDGIASSHLRDVDVVLPGGMTFSPGELAAWSPAPTLSLPGTAKLPPPVRIPPGSVRSSCAPRLSAARRSRAGSISAPNDRGTASASSWRSTCAGRR